MEIIGLEKTYTMYISLRIFLLGNLVFLIFFPDPSAPPLYMVDDFVGYELTTSFKSGMNKISKHSYIISF